MQRRAFIGAVAGAAATTSGCIGVLTGKKALEEEASPATVSAADLQDTGYELADSYSDEIQREVTAAGQTREVRAVNRIAEYHRTVDLGPLGEEKFAVFAAVSTPAFEVGEETMSPVEEWSNRKLANQLQQQYSKLEVGAEVGADSVGALDGTVELSKFEGTADVAGNTDVDVFVHVGKIQHEEDFVMVVGIYPRRLDGEGNRVETLVGGLDH